MICSNKYGMNQRGFTKIEVICASLISVIIFAASTQELTQISLLRARMKKTGDIQGELALATQHIKRVGRTATSCSKLNSSTFQCVGSFTNFNTDTVQFVLTNGENGSELQFKVKVAGVFSKVATYQYIQSLEICPGNELVANTCSFSGVTTDFPAPAPMPQAASLASLSPVRYFRFRIKGPDSSAESNTQIIYQSAFTIRYSPSLPNITYQVEG